MPRTKVQTRQRNKPFKGKKANEVKKQAKVSKTKKITKRSTVKRLKNHRQQIINERKTQRNLEVQKISTKNQYLDSNSKSIIIEKLKDQSQVKIVLLLPCNEDADTHEVINLLYAMLNKEDVNIKLNSMANCHSLEIFPIKGKTNIRSNLHIIAPLRNLQTLQQYAKVADIVCPVISCKSTNTQGMNLDPFEKGKAFDQIGYVTMNIIRNIGVPSLVGVLQHVDFHQQKHHDKVVRLFRRFLQSQLGEQQKFVNLSEREEGLSKLIRSLDCTNPIIQKWKNQRGYMLVQNIKEVNQQNKSITVQGFLKGNSIHSNQLVHVTGFDDYQLEKIQITVHPSKVRKLTKMQDENNLVQYATKPQSLYPFSKKQFETAEFELVNALNEMQLGKKEQELIEEEGQFQDASDEVSFDEDDEGQNLKEQEKQKRVQMQMRKQDQLQFQDQVEYAAEEILRQKYKDYQGLKSFKNSQWNSLENLPQQYDRIYTFKNFQKTYTNVIKSNIANGFAYPGFYISITIKGFPIEKLQSHLEKYPLIVSFLHTHQRKMTVLHAKVHRNPYYSQSSTVFSNNSYLISMGFRRIVVNPMFSQIVVGTQKTKYTKKIQPNNQNYFYCSFYHYNYFPPAPILIYGYAMDCLEKSPVMVGQLVKCDPMHIILERIILTGYPYKIYKRRCTARFMFFNPKDVKYFKSVEVITKMGLRGCIQQSLGTHGLMKCLFNDRIKHNDTICMHLYRRVFPSFQF